MRRIDRREFLKLTGGTAAALPFARITLADAQGAGQATRVAAAQTTLETTIIKGALLGTGTLGSYYRLATGPGEPWTVREELGTKSTAPISSALSFAHYTDIHLIDAQSPGRVEFLDRYADTDVPPCVEDIRGAFRPQETLTTHVLEAMNRQTRTIGIGPATGEAIGFVVCTGDNIDNEQYNEVRWFIDLMDGGKVIRPNSGRSVYDGVQAADWGDAEYWHPGAGVTDKYKTKYGFPDYPGLLADAIKMFRAQGAGIPWIQSFGNHDGLMQGNAPRNEAFNSITVGSLKFDGPPPGIDPCNPFLGLGTDYLPTRPVTRDQNRRVIRRREYVAEHFRTTGTPRGHGFTTQNTQDGTAYYVVDRADPLFRFISLDTVNPGGFSEGSVGAAQFAWLEQRLIEVHGAYYDETGTLVSTGNADRLVVLFSHHGLRSLNNPLQDPNPDDPGSNDLPRIMADEVEALLHRFPNVIAWVNGHTHDNVIDPRPDPSGLTSGFWDIGTAAHVDWSCQSRIVEFAVREDGAISIFGTMVDHAAPVDPTGATGMARLASIHRELSANDYQYGFDSKGPGEIEDRNVELTLPPLPWLASARSGPPPSRASRPPRSSVGSA